MRGRNGEPGAIESIAERLTRRAREATTRKARDRWYAHLEAEGVKGETQLEEVDRAQVRCFLGHACAALDAPRTIAMVDTTEHVFFGEPVEPFSDIHLPDAVARALDITRYGQLSRTVTMRGRNGEPVEIESVAELNDETALSPAEAAEWLRANEALLDPYGTPERTTAEHGHPAG